MERFLKKLPTSRPSKIPQVPLEHASANQAQSPTLPEVVTIPTKLTNNASSHQVTSIQDFVTIPSLVPEVVRIPSLVPSQVQPYPSSHQVTSLEGVSASQVQPSSSFHQVTSMEGVSSSQVQLSSSSNQVTSVEGVSSSQVQSSPSSHQEDSMEGVSSSQVQPSLSSRQLTSMEGVSSSQVQPSHQEQAILRPPPSLKRSRIILDLANLPSDPGLRPRMSEYSPNDRDSVRIAYLLKGPYQPLLSPFPATIISGKNYRFGGESWYNEYGDWLEYSVEEDAIFCLHCYLFKPDYQKKGGGESFVVEGFRSWNNKQRLGTHMGRPNSDHHDAYNKGKALLKKQTIEPLIVRQSDQSRIDYRIRLQAVVDCIRFLLRQGLAFRGHDESSTSTNQGNFLELLKYTAKYNQDIYNVLENAPRHCKLTSPEIQKAIVNAAAVETTNVILEELGGSFFSILVDESRDISVKEQMAVVLRFVNKLGCVVERFLGIVHVSSTHAITLKTEIDGLLSKHGLCISRLRGQGYDGASNMQGEYNGLKALILQENESAYYIHCFAHQLQLALVGVSRKVDIISEFFNTVSSILNCVLASCKRRDALREEEASRIFKAIQCGDLLTGSGLNQEMGMKRPGDTRWGSHYDSLLNLIHLFPSVVEVLDVIRKDGSSLEQRGEATSLLRSMHRFDFVFILFFMRNMLGITNDLSQALQKRDQDIVNAMTLVKVAKERLQAIREDDWNSLMATVSSFCDKNKILVLKMDDEFVPAWRPPRKGTGITNLHHYSAEVFYKCVDWQREELDRRFDEVNTELLLCMACLDPRSSFSSFDKDKLIKLAKFYPNDFSAVDIMKLEDQLENYIIDVRSSDEFSMLDGISSLAKKMVETKKNITYPRVFLLITLALILPVATATVERAFSAMSIIKNKLRNRMGDEWLNDIMVTYIENEIFNSIDDEAIMQRFQMEPRRGQL